MGWVSVASCASPSPLQVGPDRYEGSGGYPASNTIKGFATGCLTGQSLSGTVYSLQELPASSRTAIRYKHTHANNRGQAIEVFQRDIAVSLPSLWLEPDLLTERPPKVEVPPEIAPYVKPDWYSEIDPGNGRTESKEPSNDRKPEREPTKEIRIAPGTQTRVVQYYRTRTRTRTREKEQKFQGSRQNVRSIFNWLARNKERLTEFDDLLDIFIEAMPKDVQDRMPKRNGRGTPDLKMRHIYDNFDKIDWSKFAEEWVKNWIEDKVVGTAIAASDKAAKMRGETNTIGSRAWLHKAR